MNVTLRSAQLNDVDWLEPFYEQLMRPYVELTHTWEVDKFRECFKPELTNIIQADGLDIGMLKTEDKGDHIYLADIQISKEFQNHGIGTSLINNLLSAAHAEGKPVRLRVLKGNPAKEFYQRLGFVVFQELDNCHELTSETRPSNVRIS